MRECNAVIKCVCNKYLASNTKKLKMHTNGAHWEDQKETQRTCLRERAAARGSQSRVYISVPIDGRRRRALWNNKKLLSAKQLLHFGLVCGHQSINYISPQWAPGSKKLSKGEKWCKSGARTAFNCCCFKSRITVTGMINRNFNWEVLFDI